MIFTRYIAINILKGSFLVLLVLVSLNLFFTLMQQVDTLRKGAVWDLAIYPVLAITGPGHGSTIYASRNFTG